jgi:hypothetical protein
MRKVLAAVAITLLVAGCAQVKEQQFVARCAVGRAPLEGELMPGQGKVGDYKTSPWPWASSHPVVQYCDVYGKLHVVVEQQSTSSIESVLSNPISKGMSMLTLPVL